MLECKPMFVRVKRLRAGKKTYEYVHLVETRRDHGVPRQRVIASLGRLDELLATGDLERVIRQLVEQCPAVKIRKAQEDGTLQAISDKLWGPALVFGQLWNELGLPGML